MKIISKAGAFPAPKSIYVPFAGGFYGRDGYQEGTPGINKSVCVGSYCEQTKSNLVSTDNQPTTINYFTNMTGKWCYSGLCSQFALNQQVGQILLTGLPSSGFYDLTVFDPSHGNGESLGGATFKIGGVVKHTVSHSRPNSVTYRYLSGETQLIEISGGGYGD